MFIPFSIALAAIIGVGPGEELVSSTRNFMFPDSNRGVTVVYGDPDGDGAFSPQATYSVDAIEALAAFSRSVNQNDVEPGGLYYDDGTGKALRIGNTNAFIEFLASHYTRVGGVATNAACDNGATIDFTHSCPYDCDPPSDCEEHVTLTTTVTCFNDPPCPSAKPTCLARPDRVVATAFAPWPCYCDNDPLECLAEAATVVTYITTGPVCECADLSVPAVSSWGLIVLALSVLAAGTIINRRFASSKYSCRNAV